MAADPSGASIVPHQRLAQLMDGYLITQLLYIAAMLGSPISSSLDHAQAWSWLGWLALSPTHCTECYAGSPLRTCWSSLPMDASTWVRWECCYGRTSLTRYGARSSRGELYYQAAAGLLAAVRSGGPAFPAVHGRSFFEYLAQDPEREARFQASMRDRAQHEAAGVLTAYDFGAFRRLVDVGGGTGILLAAILQSAPHLEGVLFDRPAVITQATAELVASGVAERCTAVGGNFFAAVPTGGDGYLLSRVIHDWDDAAATQILLNCAQAMGGAGTLLLVEALLPERAYEDVAAIHMDLHMLTLLGGHERTAMEYRRLLDTARLFLTRIIPTGIGGVSLIEAVPADRARSPSG